MSVLAAPTELATCTYQRAIEDLKAHPKFDGNDAAIIRDWEDTTTSANRVARELRLAGFKTSATSVKDHRRNECICGVSA